MPHDFHFLRPLWLLLLIPLALLLWRLARTQGGGDAWRSVVDAHLLPRLLADEGGGARRLPLALLGIGWLLGALALAGPVWERLPEPVYQAQDYRVILLDISPSMNAADLPPSRLARARFEVLDLLHRAREGQTALVAYGAEPFVVSPLTSDTETIAAQVPNLETALLPVEGAARADLALEKAGELLTQAGAPDGEVILVADALEYPAAAQEAARKLKAEGYRVSVLGVGTEKGAPVPLAEGGFLKDGSGGIRMSRLDSDALHTLAAVGGGRYVDAGPDDRDVEALIPKRAEGLMRHAEQQDTVADRWREEGPLLLLLVLPLAALAFRRGWLSPLVLLLLLAPPPDVHAFGWQDLWLRPDQQAARAFSAGEHAAAAQRFQRPDWRAAAQYEAGDYDQALQSLDKIEGPRADYNRGNSLARTGRLEDAIAAYDRTLAVQPDDADARYNRDLVQRLLDQQRRQQQQQQGKQGSQDQQGQQGQQGQQQQQQQGRQGQQQEQGPQGQQGQQQQAQQGQQQQAQQGQQDQSGQQQRQGEQQKGEQGHQEQQREKSKQGQQGAKGDQSQQAKRQGEQAEKDLQAQKGEQGQEREKEQQAENGREGDRAKQEQAPQQAQKEQAARQAQSGQEPKQAELPTADQTENSKPEIRNPQSPKPGVNDLLGNSRSSSSGSATPEEGLDLEDRQAMEQMLRRVEDDPGGLLRQRFLLQHLRRTGQLP